jgi:hypothetical protein
VSAAPIGYYVHHHGEGHRRRAVAVARHAPGRFTLIGSGLEGTEDPFRTLDLPDDRLPGEGFSGDDGCANRPASLHYAPVRHPGVQDRMRAIATWIAETRPSLMIVDVSVEIAMLARLCAVPTVYVRLAGARWDAAHLDAFRGAEALLAPFDPRCEDPGAPDWVRAKTRYAPGLGADGPAAAPADNVVLVAFGRGGTAVSGTDLAAAARATPDRRWRAIGEVVPAADPPANLEIAGWVDGASEEIARADIVVAGAGDGILGAVAAAGRPFVCIPEERPFGEQRAKAAALDAAGAAVVLPAWPAPRAWPNVLSRARELDTRRLSTFHDPGGASAAAAFILELADR